MPKIAKVLSAVSVNRLINTGFYSVGGVSGLHLQVSQSGTRAWILRAVVGDKRRDMGLGSFPAVTLAKAREFAKEYKEQINLGIDPVERKKRLRVELAQAAARSITFDECGRSYIDAHSKGWKNSKHRQQWTNTLSTYVSPIFGHIPVCEVDRELVLRALEPIWLDKTETASRIRGRIESILGWATVKGYREGLNPAIWRNNLEHLLSTPSKVAKTEHHPALPYIHISRFMDDLDTRKGISALALRFLILTCARSGEIRGATWDEFDLTRKIWTIPARRMKAEKEHRVPLSTQSVDVLEALPKGPKTALVFGSTGGVQLSGMAMAMLIRRMDNEASVGCIQRYIDPCSDERIVTPHGFRSTFRDWAGETTSHPREVCEHALSHQLADKAEAAYSRGTLFEKRRNLMDDWARYCSTNNTTAKVVPIKGAL